MSIEQDYYEALEIHKTANGDEIKSSYRKLAMKYHPDRNPNNKEAEEKFKYISQAYEVLKDDQKRSAYDRYGHKAFTSQGSGGGSQGPFGGGFEFDFGGGGFSDLFTDIFSEFMGGGTQRGSRRSKGRKGEDLQQQINITLEEAFTGVQKEIKFAKNETCKTCNGHGTKDGKEAPVCSNCGGHGKIRIQKGFFMMEQPCPKCGGSGKAVKEACNDCRGQGYNKINKNLKFSIPSGIEAGSRIRLEGEGNSGTGGGENGDFYVFIDIKKHKLYEREANHLYTEMPISFTTAALGGIIEIPAIDGEKLEIKIPSGSQTGDNLKIRDKGMTILHSKNGSRGDLYIGIKVEVPKHLTKRQKELLEEFQSIDNEKSHPDSKSFLDKIKDLFV